MAEGLKLVSVFLTELLGPLGCLRHVGLAGYGSLNHLPGTNNNTLSGVLTMPVEPSIT